MAVVWWRAVPMAAAASSPLSPHSRARAHLRRDTFQCLLFCALFFSLPNVPDRGDRKDTDGQNGRHRVIGRASALYGYHVFVLDNARGAYIGEYAGQSLVLLDLRNEAL